MIRIGTAGWTIPKPLADDFPQPGQHLERYGRILHGAEINTSFYRTPRASTWAKWAGAVPDDFRFAVKVQKTITHDARLTETAELLRVFLDASAGLAKQRGPLLFPLPPSLAFTPVLLASFLTLLRGVYGGPAVFEPRHRSWFTPEADAVFRSFHVARAAADPARTPEAASPGGWPGFVYYRLHGSPRTYYSAYTEAYLSALAAELIAVPPGTEAWCIFDNTAAGAALGNALSLQKLLASACRLPSPPLPAQAVP